MLKPIWFLVFQKTKSWLPARHVVQAGSYPRTKGAEDFPRTGKRRGHYSGKIVFGFPENNFEMSINHLKLVYIYRDVNFMDSPYQSSHSQINNNTDIFIFKRF